MNYTKDNSSFLIRRYPQTDNKSLRAWNSADEHLLNYLDEEKINTTKPIIYNDRFGFLSIFLHQHNPRVVCNYKSQEKAIIKNAHSNVVNEALQIVNPFELNNINTDLALIKVPKSLDLFELQLAEINKNLSDDGIVICGFMTKYFSPQIIKIAEQYFDEYFQTKAWKKSRLLILKKKKSLPNKSYINSIIYNANKVFKQYYGVFSAKNIDYATQFFIEHLKTPKGKLKALDLASGNGVIAYIIQSTNPDTELHLLDDSFLAIESSKMNLNEVNTYYHYCDNLDELESNSFDLVVSNPPFHFDHENNIEVAIKLFHQTQNILKKGGIFQMVTSRHLNLYTHLIKIFSVVNIAKENQKFVIYHCIK